MHMIQMLGLVTVVYFLALALIALNRDNINVRVGNCIFVIVDIILYGFWMYGAHIQGSKLDIFMMLGNVSPLTCIIFAATPLFSDKIKDMAYSMIAFLHLGIFAAMYISPEHAYLFNFNEQATPMYTGEALCHAVCSMFGIYLILTRQVKPCFESWLKSIKFLFTIIFSGVIFNFIFHERLFGMDPYGNYSIYMIDIFGSFGATLLAYLLGVLLVLTVGMQSGKLLDRVFSHGKAVEPESESEIVADAADKLSAPTECTEDADDGENADPPVISEE